MPSALGLECADENGLADRQRDSDYKDECKAFRWLVFFFEKAASLSDYISATGEIFFVHLTPSLMIFFSTASWMSAGLLMYRHCPSSPLCSPSFLNRSAFPGKSTT